MRIDLLEGLVHGSSQRAEGGEGTLGVTTDDSVYGPALWVTGPARQ